MVDRYLPRLERGLQLLEQSANEPDRLGVVLLAFQGALVDYLRSLLATNTSISETEREALGQQGITALIEIGRRYGDLSREQADRILAAERLRLEFVRGDQFGGSPGEVRAYGRFVAELCELPELAQRIAGARTVRQAPQADVEDDLTEPGLYQTIMRWLPGLMLIGIILVGGWMIFDRVASNALSQVSRPGTLPTRTGPTPTYAPITVGEQDPLLAATPEPARSRGRIVRLGGGPGWLHSQPNFESPTLPIQLTDGQEVELLDQQQNDAQGNPWVLVAVNGYQGWSPLNNVDTVSTTTP